MFSTALMLGLHLQPRHGRRLERHARGPARGPRRARDRLRRRALRAPLRRRRRRLRVPDPRRAPVGRRPRRPGSSSSAPSSSAAAGSTSASATSPRASGTAHISDNGPAWWVWGLIALAIVLALNYIGVRIAVGAMLTFAAVSFVPMLILAIVIVAQGWRRRHLALVFDPGETRAPRPHGRRRARRRAARDPPLRRLRGRRLDRRGVARPAPLDPARRALHDRRRGRVLRRHVVRLLDGLREGGRRAGRLGGPTRRRSTRWRPSTSAPGSRPSSTSS